MRQSRRGGAFADMDLNRHVNATRYVEWMFEGLPGGFREGGGELEEIEINFSGESHAGDEIAVSTLALEPHDGPAGEAARAQFLHGVSKIADGSVVCRARSAWRSTRTAAG